MEAFERLVTVAFVAVVVAVLLAQWVRAKRYKRLGWRAGGEMTRGRIRAESAASYALLWLILGVLALSAAWWIVFGAHVSEELPWTLVPAVVLGAGGVAALAMSVVVAGSRLGVRTIFVCSRVPFVIGEMLEGTIEGRWNRTIDGCVQLTVLCEQTVHDGDGVTLSLWWGDATSIPATEIKRAPRTVRIPVSFQLPNDLPPTGWEGAGEIGWILSLRAGSGLGKIAATFRLPVSASESARPTQPRYRAVVERKINVSNPGRGQIVLDATGRRNSRPSIIRVDQGTVFLIRGKVEEIKATSIRAIDIVTVPHDRYEVRWSVRIHTVGGKTVTAAPHIASKAGAEAVARQLEDILTGFDRQKVDELFGPGS